MTTVVNTVNASESALVPNPYDNSWTGQICPSCGVWYQGFHQCVNTPWPVYPTYQPPTADPFVEFKKLYRKLIVDKMVETFKRDIEEHYRDQIDKPVREDVVQWLEGIAIDLISKEPFLP